MLIMPLSFTQEIPNSYLGVQLGVTESNFLNKNTDAQLSTKHLEFNRIGILIQRMTIYSLTRRTQSNVEVKMYCGFYDNVLAIIYADYVDITHGNAIYKALVNKYGKNSSQISFNNPATGQEIMERSKDGKITIQSDDVRHASITDSYCWDKTVSTLHFLYTHSINNDLLGKTELLFADKRIQQAIKNYSNRGLIE